MPLINWLKNTFQIEDKKCLCTESPVEYPSTFDPTNLKHKLVQCNMLHVAHGVKCPFVWLNLSCFHGRDGFTAASKHFRNGIWVQSRVTLYTAGTCTQPCPIVHTAVPPLFTQPCPGRTMSTAVCIYVAGLCASCPAVLRVTRDSGTPL